MSAQERGMGRDPFDSILDEAAAATQATPTAPAASEDAAPKGASKQEGRSARRPPRRRTRPAAAKDASASAEASEAAAEGPRAEAGSPSPADEDGGDERPVEDGPGEDGEVVVSASLLARADQMTAPPKPSEASEQLNVRVPVSLRANLRRIAAALRDRQGTGSSPRSVPEQEVVVMALWLLGSAEDDEAMAELGEAFAHFRRRRALAEWD